MPQDEGLLTFLAYTKIILPSVFWGTAHTPRTESCPPFLTKFLFKKLWITTAISILISLLSTFGGIE